MGIRNQGHRETILNATGLITVAKAEQPMDHGDIFIDDVTPSQSLSQQTTHMNTPLSQASDSSSRQRFEVLRIQMKKTFSSSSSSSSI